MIRCFAVLMFFALSSYAIFGLAFNVANLCGHAAPVAVMAPKKKVIENFSAQELQSLVDAFTALSKTDKTKTRHILTFVTTKPAAKIKVKKVLSEHEARILANKYEESYKKANMTSQAMIEKLEKLKRAPEEREMRRRMNSIPVVTLPDVPRITFRSVANMVALKSEELQAAFLEIGEKINTLDDYVSTESAHLALLELGFETRTENLHQFEDVQRRPIPDDLVGWKSRPPVVCVMGHVNHGKTSFIDYLRKSSIAASEVGGITQTIGAFLVSSAYGELCIMDTPGHAAFRHMRALGAHLTDIVVLIVAADDSVMPQTIEAIRLTQEANVPVVVAVNKCDLYLRNFEVVKKDLGKHGIYDESEGGTCYIVPISAKTGLGIDEMLEKISFLAEILDLRADYEGPAEAMIVESKVDRGKGVIVNAIVDRGCLHVGDPILSEKFSGKVKTMINHLGVSIDVAYPSTPVSIIGLDGAPEAGSDILVVPDVEQLEIVAEKRREKAKAVESFKRVIESKKKVFLFFLQHIYLEFSAKYFKSSARRN